MSELYVKVLDEGLEKKILDEAIELLRDPGIKVHNNIALELLYSSGAVIDKESNTVSIPSKIIEESLKSVPAGFTLFSLDGDPCVMYGADRIHFVPGSTSLSILDWDQQKHRPPVTKDLIYFGKLVEVLDEIDAQSTSMVSSDVPKAVSDFYRLYVALNFISKPIVTGTFRKDTWDIMYDLLSTTAGGSANLEMYPIAIFDVCPSPPLLWSDHTCQNLIDCASHKIPVQIVSMPLAGATAPFTLAAAVIQQTAETLSGIIIHQLMRAGSPIVWGGSPAAVDMRFGTTPMGAPGTWLINAAYVQIAKSLRIPTHVYMGMSDAKTIDAQCGFESMGSMMMATLINANLISGAGMLDFETCQSAEKLIIDAEVIGICRRVNRGIEIRENPIALDIMREVGHTGQFLSSSHTRNWFKEELYIPTDLIDRGSLEKWKDEGSRNISERAHIKSGELIKMYKGSRITDEQKSELKLITELAVRKYGLEKLPELDPL